ncbi:hypothetical protein QU487_10710 [Crenobacter sp. SG2305]|uniref:hypothetical protein n=1 Tax=Crenobacter oryzisoli TaxID=3056844 RepID=UPI0025AAF8C5|nr:hypothetical protein [Crenobacter sp. SG2305]MDN0083222.1 hypothetical protein [Crenobacter sp. SG2305]
MNVHRPFQPSGKPVFEMPVPTAVRDLIDNALNVTLQEEYAYRPIGTVGKCHDYAIVGARVLTLLLDHPYMAVAGGEQIDCGDGKFAVIYPNRNTRRQAKHLSEMSQFHCWIQATHTVAGKKRIEIVDFTARHDGEFAKALSIEFTRNITENYLWAWNDEIEQRIPATLRDRPSMRGLKKELMWVDEVCTRLLHDHENEKDAYFGNLASRVLNRLADSIEAMHHNGA